MAPGVAPTVNLTPVQQQGPPNGDMMGGYAGGRGMGPGRGGPPRGVGPGPMGGRGGGMGGRGMGGGGMGMGAPAGGMGGPPRGGPGGRGPGPAPAPAPPVPDEDYNFEEANKHFDKEAALREAENVVKAKQAAYVKDDFFDMMSCETLDKMGHAQGQDGPHARRSMQRAVDIETFGGLGGVRHFHHRGRGRGRGGRGGYGRGGGGGFYNNPQGGRGPRQ